MIEFTEQEQVPLGYKLQVNGAPMEITMLRTERDLVIPRLNTEQLTTQFIEHRFSDLPSLLGGFELSRVTAIDPEIYVFRTIVRRVRPSQDWSIECGLAFNPDVWNQPFSISDYALELVSMIDEMADPSFRAIYREHPVPENEEVFELWLTIAGGDRVKIEMAVSSPNTQISVAVQELTQKIRSVNERVRRSLTSRAKQNSVVSYFTFPEEVRVPCEQYLLYFVKFLQDLGVEATSELRHDAGQVLFSVKPSDAKQALNKIRMALDVYLRLPSSPISDSNNDEIPVQRLEANVLRLRGDLKLAAAELQAKNATIDAQQLTIEVQKRMLSGEIVIDSLKATPDKSKDREELLGGTLAIIPVEGKGIRLNLPEIFRRLRDLFRDK